MKFGPRAESKLGKWHVETFKIWETASPKPYTPAAKDLFYGCSKYPRFRVYIGFIWALNRASIGFI